MPCVAEVVNRSLKTDCTDFTRKLEVAAKNFRLLIKNRLMHWQIRGLKGSISGNFVLYA